ncbi:MAG: hypothetical protein ABI588_05445 [Arenimonas sp.]
MIRRIALLPVALALGFGLAGCAKPVPAAKSAYVGEWQQAQMYLLITQDGSVSYKRLKAGGQTSVEGPLKGFDGDDFSVGFGPMTTRFDVTVAPHQLKDGSWKMTVDGLELTRAAQ